MRKGKIEPNGVVLRTHEMATVVFLTEHGFNVKLIPTSNIAGVHTPDLEINGVRWEMKAPLGEGNQLMKNTIQRALKQSANIIVDLRRTKRYQDKCIRELKIHFNGSKNTKRLKIITKGGRIIDIEK